MGNCMEKLSEEEKLARKKNQQIEKMMNQERKKLRDEVKLLLLGTGESGKSTIFKQMKVISAYGGFKPEELEFYRTVVFANCVTQMKVLTGALAKLDIKLNSKEAEDAAQRMTVLPSEGDAWTTQVGEDIKTLWKDAGIQQVYAHRDKEFQLNDSTKYFFDDIDRINESSYTPTTQDVLRARIRSTGIEEAKFRFDNMEFTMVDVGGQRSERRKWIHCFETVTAVLFTVSLSEYDQTLREDPTQNRSKESLALFEEILNSQWFTKTAFILFLNKTDLFEEKLKVSPLSATFKNYTGGADLKAGQNFMKDLFVEKHTGNNKLYPHFTCAVNTKHLEVVFKVVRETITTEIIDVLF